MVSCKVHILAFLLVILIHASRGDELPREAVLSWFRERVLESLDLEDVPQATVQDGDAGEERRRGPPKISRMSTVRVNQKKSPSHETTQVIVFPSSDSSCAPAPRETTNSHFTYYFKASVNNHETLLASAHFWFYAGEEASSNSSAELSILTSAQELLQAAESAPTTSSDGWLTFDLLKKLLAFVAEGSFLLQVRCESCECHANEPDKMPFLHLHTRPRASVRSPRQAPVTIPWSPSAINLLQRPSQERPQHGDCHRAEIQISFQELGWDNWIVHPEVLTFYYCHGNCSDWDGTSAMLGIRQCCAPTPGTMRSLRITTTSDGGYSYKYETLPNIIPEECTCI